MNEPKQLNELHLFAGFLLTEMQKDTIIRNEKMHTLYHSKTNVGFSEVNSRPAMLLVQTMREGLPKRDLQKESRIGESACNKLARKVCRESFRTSKAEPRKVLRNRDCEKIRNDEETGGGNDRITGRGMQGLRRSVRQSKAIIAAKFRPLPHYGPRSWIPLLAMQYRSRTRSR